MASHIGSGRPPYSAHNIALQRNAQDLQAAVRAQNAKEQKVAHVAAPVFLAAPAPQLPHAGHGSRAPINGSRSAGQLPPGLHGRAPNATGHR